MKITICASMAFADKMLMVKNDLEKFGHQVLISGLINNYLDKTPEQITQQTIIDKNENDAIREHWHKIKQSDAILVLNYDRKNIKNYIGGNTLMEIGFAHVLKKKIFLLNPIPEIEYYQSEIKAVKPVILHGDLHKI